MFEIKLFNSSIEHMADGNLEKKNLFSYTASGGIMVLFEILNRMH